MQPSEISWDPESGVLTQSGIRYVLMRPDVIMGTAAHLPHPEEFISAMSESAFENARDSFVRYRESGALNGADPVEHACGMAAQLGWGQWTVTNKDESGYIVSVRNSPFAFQANGGRLAMCGWITGVLRATIAANSTSAPQVRETHCAAQGHADCEFEIRIG